MTIDPRDDVNPFAAPRAEIGHRTLPLDLENDDEAELVRRYHLSHETSVRAVGLLNYLLAGFCLFLAFVMALMALGLVANPPQAGGEIPFQLQGFILVFGTIFYGIIASVALGLGFGLRRLQAWARWATIVLSTIALVYLILMMIVVLAFLPLPNPAIIALLMGAAVAILAYVFYLMVAPKGAMVFSSEYKQVIARTPGIRARSSLIVRLFIGLLVSLLTFLVIGGVVQLLLRG